MSDLYARLGLSRDAKLEDIRRAYKDQAKVKHPDRGGNAEEFKAIQEAHEVLTDEGRRKMYDLTGSAQEGGGGGGGGGMAAGGIPFNFMGGMGPFGGMPGMPGVTFNMSEVFGNMFGGRGGPQQKTRSGRGPNKFHDVGLRLVDFYKGHEFKLRFNQSRRCTGCSGSGAETSEPCGPCNGRGIRMIHRQIGPNMIAQTQVACDNCNGDGTRTIRVCKACQGKKNTEQDKQLDVKITPGMHENDTMAFIGECSDSAEFETPGDVVLTLKRSEASVGDIGEYEWKNDDLYIRKSISYVESILGFTMTLADHPNSASPTFNWRGGPLIHGAMLKMMDYGMPKKGGSGYGNLYIQVAITPPELKPWSVEDAAKLQSVLGGPAVALGDAGLALLIHTSESQMTPGKN